MGLLKNVKQLLQRCRKKYTLMKTGEQLIQGDCVRIPCSSAVIEICLGGTSGHTLQLQPDLSTETCHTPSWPTYWVVDMDRVSTGMGGFLRLQPNQELTLGRYAPEQNALFEYSTHVAHRHLSLIHQGEQLQLTDLGSEHGTCVRLIPDPERCILLWRRDQWQHLQELLTFPSALRQKRRKHPPTFSPPLQPLPEEEAMARLQRAHELLLTAFTSSQICTAPPERAPEKKKKQKHRGKAASKKRDKERDDDSVSSAPTLIHVPAHSIPLIVGDLHAKVDNLLTILTTGCLLTALAQDTITLIILGDAVHPNEPDQLEEMESSMLIMDIIVTLMIRFPGRIIYLRGNHDGFSEEIYKGRVCQGQVWNRALIRTRGRNYRNAMKAFYRDLPYVAIHPRLVATHAAPPVTKPTRETLENLHIHPDLIHQLTWNRMIHPNRPGGYREQDVSQFRHLFDLPDNAAVVVGHTPMDGHNTAWLHAGDIPHHHVVHSCLLERVGWLISFPNSVVHMECPVAGLNTT